MNNEGKGLHDTVVAEIRELGMLKTTIEQRIASTEDLAVDLWLPDSIAGWLDYVGAGRVGGRSNINGEVEGLIVDTGGDDLRVHSSVVHSAIER